MFCGKTSRLHAIAKERGDTFRLYEGGPERHEISDEGAILRCSRPEDKARLLAGTTLGKALHHPALFAAYPELASLKVRIADAGEGFNASFSPRGITLSKATLDQGDAEALRSGLIHELQHAIQLIENDVEGSTPAMMEKLVMREVLSSEIDNVAKLLQGELHASKVEFQTVKAFTQLISNPRLAMRDTEVRSKLARAGFSESEVSELGAVCEAIFKLKGLSGRLDPLRTARLDIRQDQIAVYQAKDGELEAHLTARRLHDPQDGRIPVAHSEPNEMPLKWRLMWAFDCMVFRIKMTAARAIQEIKKLGNNSSPDGTGEARPELRIPQIRVVGAGGLDRPIERVGAGILQRGRLVADPTDNREIIEAIRCFRSMNNQERQQTVAAAAATSERFGSLFHEPPSELPPLRDHTIRAKSRAPDLDMAA